MVRGCLLIADITGYTAYLSDSELEHAEESLSSILNVLLEHTRSPLVLSRLEGDALISYVPEHAYHQGQTVIEIIENTYVAFRRGLDLMVLNTTCDCNACRNLSALDLKFFVHFGEFLTQKFDRYTELIGSDVNLIHRLTKNSITTSHGIKAYTAYTEAAALALEVPGFFEGLQRHMEHYEHFGEVQLLVQDMAAVWERERDAQRLSVPPAEALFRWELDLPVDQVQAWDYVTEPEFRSALSGASSTEIVGGPDDRLGKGASYVCVHGTVTHLQTIVDWQPFDQYTFEGSGVFPGTRARMTTSLEQKESGTRLSVYVGRGLNRTRWRRLDDMFRRIVMPGIFKKTSAEFLAKIDRDRQRRRFVQQTE